MINIYDLKVNNDFNLKDLLLGRIKASYSKYQSTVDDILLNVKTNGDKALCQYTEQFDQVKFTQKDLKISKQEIEEAYTLCDEKLIHVVRKAKERIKDYHEKQMRNSWFNTNEDGSIIGQKISSIEKVGIYVPGGKAVYPSSVLMNAVPAKVAGVNKIVMVTPPLKSGKIDPLILIAANEAGVDEIYKVGGAQGVAALAYGTETVPKVHKIVGPGNVFVALAKKSVYGEVGIDSIAGPSEILVLADETANEKYIAADLLSQAEHDELASAVLITTSVKLAEKVKEQLIIQTESLSRKEIIKKSLKDYGALIVAEDIEKAIELCNEYAPEHLEVCTKDPFSLLPKIKNAGAIFLGNYSPEPLGDYMAGPNHVLPTCSTAKFFSPLSVDDFIKKSSIISFNKDALYNLKDDIITFATAEQLTAHANAVRVRFEND